MDSAKRIIVFSAPASWRDPNAFLSFLPLILPPLAPNKVSGRVLVVIQGQEARLNWFRVLDYGHKIVFVHDFGHKIV